jgi:crotonobetainyl-CoA:carnitine CoA-transferase CaiB-like acyl-CoA transferase
MALSELEPLEGWRVLEKASGVAACYAGKLFTDAGADVVKIEPAGGEPMRRWRASGDSAGALFRFLSHGKQSSDAEADIAALVAGADLVLTDDPRFASDARVAAPTAVITVISPFGAVGPYSHRPASDLTIQAESGSLATRHHPSLPPCMLGGRIAEWVAGVYAAVASIAATRRSHLEGRPETIDVSIAEVMNIAGSAYSDLANSLRGRPDIPGAIRISETPEIHPTADGWVGMTTNSRQQFDDLLVMIERPDLLGDEELATGAGRRARFEEWTKVLESWTESRPTAEIVAAARTLRIPCAKVNDAEGAFAHEHFRARDVFVPDPTGTFAMPRRPYLLRGATPPSPRLAPSAGSDNGQIEWTRRDPTPTGDRDVLPLEGVRILDMTSWWAGPAGTGLLAALGAEVIHVEAIQRLDGHRGNGGAIVGFDREWWEHSPQFLSVNTNKFGLTLDLSSERGRELLVQLLGVVDGLVENFSPRVLPSFGLDNARLAAINPRLIVVRMPAFGLDGPLRDGVGFAQTMEQMTSLAWLTGHVDDRPHNQRGPCDPNAGAHAAFAFIVALVDRDRDGDGQIVEVPMVESALNIAAESLLAWSAGGERLGRQGNRAPWSAPQNLYRCRAEESWLAISVETDDQWTGLVRALGSPAWASAPGLASVGDRLDRHDELDERIGEWARDRDAETAADLLLAEGVPAAVMADPRRSSTHPPFVARGFFELVSHPVAGTHPVVGMPFRFSSVDSWVRSPAPTLGQHNDEILGGLLGLDPSELDELRAARVIGSHPLGL